MTILEAVNQIPPCACRLIARKHHGTYPLSSSELAQLSGLPRSTINELSLRTSWAGIPVDVADQFANACGVNHLAAKRQLEYLRRRKLQHFKFARGNQRAFFAKIMEAWAKAGESRTSPDSPPCSPTGDSPAPPTHNPLP